MSPHWKIVTTCIKFEYDEGALRSRKQGADIGTIAGLEIIFKIADDMENLMIRSLLPMTRAFASFCAISINREKMKMAMRRTGASTVLTVGLRGQQFAILAPALAQGKKKAQGLEAGHEKPVGLTAAGSILLKREST